MSEVIYKIRVNTPCRLFIDEEEVKGLILAENKLTKITLPEGEYLRKVVAVEDNTIFHETGIALSGASKLDIITLDISSLNRLKHNALPKEKFRKGDLLYEAKGDGIEVAVAGCADENVSEVVIPERITYGKYTYKVTSIAAGAFKQCTSLTSVTLPNSITSIQFFAFTGCESLTSITIPNGVKEIESDAFKNCYKLTSITIPNSVESIGMKAFTNCYELASVTIPNSVTFIRKWAFYSCKILTSITIPNGVRTIDERAFCGCLSLTSVTIPESVTSIGDCAFDRCEHLTSVTILGSVTSIGEDAFPEHTKIIRE
jgi:hypothetical protein